MPTRLPLEVYRSRNARNNDMDNYHRQLKSEKYHTEKAAYEQTPEHKLGVERRQALQHLDQGKKAKTKLLCDVYETFYLETTAIIEKEFNEYYLPKLQAGAEVSILEEFGKHYNAHIELLTEIDRIQVIHSASTARNYIKKLTRFLENLSSDYDVCSYFNLTKTNVAGV